MASPSQKTKSSPKTSDSSSSGGPAKASEAPVRNLDRYRKDIEALLQRGEFLSLALQHDIMPEQVRSAYTKALGKEKAEAFLKKLPTFDETYQGWYSEALAVIKQLLPDRVADFVRHYERPKTRKDITFENYTIEDALHGLRVTRGWEKEVVVDSSAAIPRVKQQLAILKAVKARFESSLFDIRKLVQADLFDSELDAARELLKNGFGRAAGAVAGVVLEKHLREVATSHNVILSKKAPSISDWNDALKQGGVIEVATWRFIQHLGDLRNLCDHDKQKEPTKAQVDDLIVGVDKLIKTVH